MIKHIGVPTLLRVVLGIIFLAHGISKLQMGLGNVEAWFSSMGVPGFMAYVAAFVELAGGILLIVGLFTRVVSALFIVLMLGAIVTVKLSSGLLGHDQAAGYELELSLVLISIYLLASGPAALSLDHLIFNKRRSA
ncbi:DoxX family protein [Paenibacillus chibensis]|uniref:DoxX family protein n=1 Tax=Paenibacillus chibensis TaxID=59846 RepID=UPI000FD8DD2D|nr:DoxX family protein [Paenibacillus chibensis]MEC0371040.1 DoxX family protein [Paenibacillus chibensis]